MRRLAMFAYSVVAYAAFLVSFSAFALFLADFLLPRTVDQGATSLSPAAAVAVNLFLVALFGVPHSIMARQGFKQRLTRLLPEPIERSTFVLVASLSLTVLMVAWQPMSSTVWQVSIPALQVLLWVVFVLGVVTVLVSTFLIDHFHLFGLKQTWSLLRGQELREAPFTTPFLYKAVRHPMMLGVLMVLWSTPRMTVGHLVLALGMSLYVFVGMVFEERDLLRAFGERYAEYCRQVPQVIPGWPRRREPALAPVVFED